MIEIKTQTKGIITELQVATYLLNLGINVSQPLSQDSRYDLIIDVNNQLYRIQIKSSKKNNNSSITFECRSSTSNTQGITHSKYTKEQIDYFATYWNDKCYLVPVEQCSSEKTLWLIKPNRKNCCFADNFLPEEVFKL